MHGDYLIPEHELHLSGYIPGLYQALLDLSDWVERGIDPSDTTEYTVKEGQMGIYMKALNIKPKGMAAMMGGVHKKHNPNADMCFDIQNNWIQTVLNME